jgi:peptidoglycan hydrolase CwlO-like protein
MFVERNYFFRDLEREFNEKQSNVQLLEKEVSEGRKRCNELEEELDQVNKEIGEARVRFSSSRIMFNFY